MDLEGYITVSQAAAELGVCPTWVGVMCKSGIFPGAVRVGPIWLIPRESVQLHRPRRVGRPRGKAGLVPF